MVAACGAGGDGLQAGRSGDGDPGLWRPGRVGAWPPAAETFVIPAGMSFDEAGAFPDRLHLEPRGDPLAGPAGAGRDAAGAGRGRRRRPHRGGDRQGHGRPRHRRAPARRRSSPWPRRTAPTTTVNYASEKLTERVMALTGEQGRRRLLRSRRRRAVRRGAVGARLGRAHPAGRLRRRRAADPGQPAPGEASRRAGLVAALFPLARAGQARALGRRAAALVWRGQAQAAGHPPPAARARAWRRSAC